jgi:hypothetical protein
MFKCIVKAIYLEKKHLTIWNIRRRTMGAVTHIVPLYANNDIAVYKKQYIRYVL